jgi:hypothetical protein
LNLILLLLLLMMMIMFKTLKIKMFKLNENEQPHWNSERQIINKSVISFRTSNSKNANGLHMRLENKRVISVLLAKRIGSPRFARTLLLIAERTLFPEFGTIRELVGKTLQRN